MAVGGRSQAVEQRLVLRFLAEIDDVLVALVELEDAEAARRLAVNHLDRDRQVRAAVAVFLALVLVLRRTPALARRLSPNISTWMFLAVVQGGIGYLQYFNGVPAVLVAAHVAGATALWVVTVQLLLAGLEPADPGTRGVDAAQNRVEPAISSSPLASA